MITIREEVHTCLRDYRASEPAIRNGKRKTSLLEYYKWEAIRAGIKRIDLEEAGE